MIIIAIIVIAALFFAWDANGSEWMLKAFAWTAGSVTALTVLLVIIGLTRH